MTNLITPRALFSPIFLQSCSQFHESGLDNPFQRYIHSKFLKMACGRLLDLVQPEVDPFYPPTHPILEPNEVARMTRFLLAHAHFWHISTSGGSSVTDSKSQPSMRLLNTISHSDIISDWLYLA